MFKISFSDSLAIVGIVATIVLVALDKAGKLKGPLPVVLLLVAAVMTLPLALGNSWVSEASPSMLRTSRAIFMIFAVGLIYSALLIWISPQQSEPASTEPATRLQEGAQLSLSAEEIANAVIKVISPQMTLPTLGNLMPRPTIAQGEQNQRLASVETIFLHFIDHDVIELFGLENIYPGGTLADPFQQLARLSVMLCTTRTNISGASCFETQYGLRLMRDLEPFVEARIFCAMGNAHDPLEYKDRRAIKLAAFPSRFPRYTSPLLADAALLGRAWLGKPTSSTLALSARWASVANEQPEFWRGLYKAADQSFTKSTMRRIHEVPERLAKRPFMVSDALDALRIPVNARPFRNAVNRLISSEWVDSFSAVIGATFLVEMPFFHTDPVVPVAAPRLSVSGVNQVFSTVGLSRVIYESSPHALLRLRLLPEWSLIRNDIVKRAGRRLVWAASEVEPLRSMSHVLPPMRGHEVTPSVRLRIDQYLAGFGSRV